MHDLAVIIVSTNEAHWLRRCLPTVFAASEGLRVDVVVVENGSTDGTGDLVRAEFPSARVVALREPRLPARQQPRADDRRRTLRPVPQPRYGGRGRHLRRGAGPHGGAPERRAWPAAGSSPRAERSIPACAASRVRSGSSARRSAPSGGRSGPRGPDSASSTSTATQHEFELDWTVGAFMLARREALESAGWLDERFFLYCDDPDLGLRIKRAGWSVRHLPQMAILHHAKKMGWNRRGHAQYAYAYRQYFAKHLSPAASRGGRGGARARVRAARARLLRGPALGAGCRPRDAGRTPRAGRSRRPAVRAAAGDRRTRARRRATPRSTAPVPVPSAPGAKEPVRPAS